MARQIRVFLDNKPGRLEKVIGLLSEKEINVRAMLISDRGDFGVVKFFVDKPELAVVVLQDGGFAAASKDVIAVKLDDKVGRLHKMVAALSAKGINISDGYGFAGQELFYIETDQLESAVRMLGAEGFKVLSDQELYQI